jgi:two-component system, OmpR family, KDP operon response regulator KdpE
VVRQEVLVIEDDPDVRRGLGVRLCAEDYQVHFATDAASGISQAKQHHPDLIILDLGLPGEDGYAVLEELGQSRELACIPVIVLSAWDRYAHEPRVRNAGAKIFCQKPVDSGELLGRIQQLLRPKAVGKTNRRRDDGNENIDRR